MLRQDGAAAGYEGFLGWFQITCLALFLTIVVGRTVSLRAYKRINPIALRLRDNGVLGVVQVALFVMVNLWASAVVLYVLSGKDRSLAWLYGPRVFGSFPVRTVGVVTIVVAFVVYILAMAALKSSWRLGIDRAHPGPLVTTGIYARSRNPIYLFFNLYLAGTFLINGAALFLVFAVLTALNLHYQIVHEERYLARVYGLAYQAYRVRTARYWTWRAIPRAQGARMTG
jgi:protein-S-isoprenylcysteine O-methyltransferase Ste14